MPYLYSIMHPTKSQIRRAVVFVIEALILAGFVAVTIIAATALLKVGGVL